MGRPLPLARRQLGFHTRGPKEFGGGGVGGHGFCIQVLTLLFV